VANSADLRTQSAAKFSLHTSNGKSDCGHAVGNDRPIATAPLCFKNARLLIGCFFMNKSLG
jgi:hypothetical protein